MPHASARRLASAGLRAFLADQLPKGSAPSLVVHDDDEMFIGARAVGLNVPSVAEVSYVNAGLQLRRVVEQLATWRFGGLSRVGSLLDFACGYGRLTRFLADAVAPERIWASDIYAEGVAFVERTFGVHGVVSATEPADLPIDRRFDLVVVPSLFSHLPGRTFTPWLARLFGLLSPCGVLAFSVQDESLRPGGSPMPKGGLSFDEASESRTLDPAEYGNTFVSEAFVAAAIEAASAGAASWTRLPRAFGHAQDVYVVVPDREERFEGLAFRYGPRGFVDAVGRPARGRLDLRGWAADPTPGVVGVEVQVFVGGALRGACRPADAREDVAARHGDARYLRSGWRCRVPLPAGLDPARDALLVKAVSDNGDSYVLSSATVDETRRFLRRQRAEARRAERTRRLAASLATRRGPARLLAAVGFHYHRAGLAGVLERVPGFLFGHRPPGARRAAGGRAARPR